MASTTLGNSVQIDSLRLVKERQVLSGSMRVAGFARLLESLPDSRGELGYRVEGDVDRQGRHLLRLQVQGAVQLLCQRCLESYEHKVAIATVLRLVPAAALDSEYDDDPDEPDCVAASVAFDLAALIEDEVLLALPSYPRHEDAYCTGRAEAVAADAADSRVSAFGVLQALRQKVIQSKE